MKLVIVDDSSTKYKLARLLGEGWRVESSSGRIRHLVAGELGVDVEHDFEPTYAVLPLNQSVLNDLQQAVNEAEAVYIAVTADRESEAAAWHLLQVLDIPEGINVHTIKLSAVTPEAITEAINTPYQLDMKQVDTAQAKHIMGRLIGYLVTSLERKALAEPYTPGRLGKVCLRLLVEREREIEQFVPETSWTIALKLESGGAPFTAHLCRVEGVSLPLQSRDIVNRMISMLKNACVWVVDEDDTIAVGKTTQQPYPMQFYVPNRNDEVLPALYPSEVLDLIEPFIVENNTTPLPRYTYKALLAVLQPLGNGTNDLSDLLHMEYARLEGDYLIPTPKGIHLNDFLTEYFGDLFSVDTMARLEAEFDLIAEGKKTRIEVLRAFWQDFQPKLARAAEHTLNRIQASNPPKPLILHPKEGEPHE